MSASVIQYFSCSTDISIFTDIQSFYTLHDVICIINILLIIHKINNHLMKGLFGIQNLHHAYSLLA